MQTIIIILCILSLGSYLIYKAGKKWAESDAKSKVSQAAEDNEPLDEPCTIHIHVKDNVKSPWRYGFSLNGQPPVFTDLGSDMELTTAVKHNALLGYGRGTYGGYKKPNVEEPFEFDAVSGGTIRLICDEEFQYKNDAVWKSNLSFEDGQEST